ncbi:MAG: LytTR family DNA-binding domain-containing protein [Flavobacteriales bacterium]
MTKLIKNRSLISVVFGIYQMLIGLFFGGYVFLQSDVNLWMYLATVFIYIAGVQFIIVTIESRIERSQTVRALFLSASFMLSAVIGGSLSYLTFTARLDHFLIYISSFLISAFLPTVLFLLYFIYQDAEERISDLKKVSLKDSRNDTADTKQKIFHLENENGKILLEVPVERIIFYEANDNYVITHYMDKNDQPKRSMERASLKKIEELLAREQVSFFRVHKSYLINPDYLDEIKGKAQAYKLQKRQDYEQNQVSRSYYISFLEKKDY